MYSASLLALIRGDGLSEIDIWGFLIVVNLKFFLYMKLKGVTGVECN